MKYLGIDFSGAKDAGRKIWIAEGTEREGVVTVQALYPATDLPGGVRHRDEALSALARYIAGLGPAIVGIDAPNSLPELYMPQGWSQWFGKTFASFPSAEHFRADCTERWHAHCGAKEGRRRCDEKAGTPFSAWNLRLYRQTWHLLRGLYVPLLSTSAVTVAPFQPHDRAKPRLAEICPASTLKHLGLYNSYKDKAPAEARMNILRKLAKSAPLHIEPDLCQRAVDDKGGDALDAVIALAATARCRGQIEKDDQASEGVVYVWG